MKKQFPFAGKETKKEERMEKKSGKADYSRGEKKEGRHGFAKGGAVKKKSC